MREFSVQMLQKIKPDAVFDEAKFEENFGKMDKNADGMVSQEELLQSLVEKAQAAHAM